MKAPSLTLKQKHLSSKHLQNDSNSYCAGSLNTNKDVANRQPDLTRTFIFIVCVYYCNFLHVNCETPTQQEFKNLYNYSINNIFPFKSDNFNNNHNNDRHYFTKKKSSQNQVKPQNENDAYKLKQEPPIFIDKCHLIPTKDQVIKYSKTNTSSNLRIIFLIKNFSLKNCKINVNLIYKQKKN